MPLPKPPHLRLEEDGRAFYIKFSEADNIVGDQVMNIPNKLVPIGVMVSEKKIKM
jgi:hypothetical protein